MLVQSIPYPTPGGGGGSISSNRWRLYVTATQGATSWLSIVEIEMRETLFSANLCSGGTPSASVQSGSHPASAAFDGSTNYYQSGTSTKPIWIEYQFAAPVAVGVFTIKATGSPSDAPKDFQLQYYDAATSAWVTATTFTGVTWHGGGLQPFSTTATNANTGACRLYVTATQTNGFPRIANLEMRAAAGGADQCTGGFPYALGANSTPDLAFDASNSTTWVESAVPPGWIAYAFPATVDVHEIAITQAGSLGDTPTAATVQHHDGSGWIDLWSFTTPATWTAGETRVFTRP